MPEGDRRLGRGLGALLGEYDTGEAAAAEREVLLARIRPNPFQPRSTFEDDTLDELAESIRNNGLLQPIVVRPVGDDFEIVAGERRYRAVQRLGWTNVPIVVRDLGDQQMLVLAMVENLQRENLSPIDEALGYQQLIEEFGLTQEEVGRHVGRDRSTVSNTLRLLGLPEELRALVASGRLSAGHARAVLSLERRADQMSLAEEIVQRDLSVRTAERRAKELAAGGVAGGEPAAKPAARRQDPVVRRAELVLERHLGTQVRIQNKANDSGSITVQFHNADDFARLLSLLGGEAMLAEITS